ncbi:MAG: hypothetical protein LUQ65_10515, partial [Candidatus Helarchaeota archaeon]|nr:hypothetical protein [Candidatus Helarchaeota archaeon]
DKIYRQKNIDHKKDKDRTYYQTNKEEIARKQKFYYERIKNTPEYKSRNEKNKGKKLQYNKDYWKKNRDILMPKVREYMKKRGELRRNEWVKFFISNGLGICSVCGYNKCFDAIDFHHNDEKNKKFGVAEFVHQRAFEMKNIERVLEELTKCTVLCSNCHRELHFEMRKSNGK